MTGITNRLSALFRAKAEKALDRAEDPREMLDYSYTQQLALLQQVRRGLADVATSRRRVETQSTQLRQSAEKLDEQARQALAGGREDLAREALARRADVQAKLAGLEAQEPLLRADEEKLTLASKRLEAEVEDFRTRKETLKASYAAAEAESSIGDATAGLGDDMGDIGSAVRRAQDKTEQLQARSAALDELIASGALEDSTLPTHREDVLAQIQEKAAGSDVEEELARLKALLPKPPGPEANR